MRKILKNFIFLLPLMAIVLIDSQAGFAGLKKDSKKNTPATLAKSAVVSRVFWTPNRIGTYVSNDGALVDFHTTGSAGMEWPVGSGNTIHFQNGLWVAGLKNGEVVTAVAEFSTEFQGGKVSGNAPGVAGTPENSQDPRFRVYLIKKEDTANPLANPDYANWPVADGAPVDAAGNPALIGSQTLWSVFNDFNATKHNNVLQTKVMGIEVQLTAWAFNRPDAFGDMIFFKYKFFNKSGSDIDSTFASFWNDVDVGDALDLVGSDIELSLGFNYKTQADGNYGDNPPAIGMDFFQGPIVPSPGDVANVSGVEVPDFKNLGMSSFAKYINGGPPQLSDPENGPEAYNFMKGLDPFGDPIINELTGEVTKFWHPGDPVAGTGWLDPNHADKRFLMNSGPFTLADGDVQEVVGGFIIAQGATGTQSVELLKRNDRVAQLAYDINFALPPSPPNPVVTMSPSENSIFLSWDAAAEAYEALDRVDIDEEGNPTMYTFQGYNVYQLDALTIGSETTVKKIASFDMKDGVVKIRDDVFVSAVGQTVNMVVEDAKDTGVQRFIGIPADAIRGNAPFIQNRPYYFAVTAYGYNPIGIPKTLESPLSPFEVRPQSQPLGTQIVSQSGDSLAWNRVSGPSDGGIQPIIVNAADLTGDSYEVRFRATADGSVYDVVNTTTGAMAAEGFVNQSDALGTEDYPLVDGVKVIVNGPALTFKNFLTVANGAGPIDPPTGAAADFQNYPVPERPGASQQVGEGKWFIHTFGNRGSFAQFIDRVSNGGNNWGNIIPFDYEIRFTAEGGYGYDPFITGAVFKVPFELWNIGINTPDDPSDDYRMPPYIIDWDADGVFGYQSGTDSPVSGGPNDPITDAIYWTTPDDKTPGDAGYKAWEAAALALGGGDDGSFYGSLTTDNHMRRYALVNWNGADDATSDTPTYNQLLPETGTIFRIITTKPNSPADVFAFSTPEQVRDNSALAAQQAADLVNVFPNPYRGFNIDERDPINRFVTFTHLPENSAKIQIFTLAGELITTIDHNNGTQFEQWDIRNQDGIPVASGIYIVRVEMGSLGVKILKVAVFQPEERLDVF